ncbi:MAG: GNAT family N-acetyltransferase [Acidimicrobiales bacterium]
MTDAPTATYEVVPASTVEPDEIIAVLSSVFDRATIGDEWFRWKHQSCPFGASEGWIARDDEGIAGVRLFTPWPWQAGGASIPGIRPMDGGVLPRARKRGIFQALVRKEMNRREAAGLPLVTLSTSVPASRAAYVKLGWNAVGDVQQFAVLVRPRPAQLVEQDPIPDPVDVQKDLDVTALRTAWTSEALGWRFDSRSGYDYRSVCLARATAPNGLVYRVLTSKGLRMLAIEYLYGPPAERRRLVQAAAASTRAMVALHLAGPGSRHDETARLSRRVGSSMITSWSTGVSDDLRVASLDGWKLDMADTEGVL